MVNTFFPFFSGLKPKSDKISNYGYWGPEKGSSGSLRYKLCRSR